MLVHEAKKIIVFLNPKTGTTTLCDIFKQYKSGYQHCKYKNIPNFNGYKIFGFHRDPVDRFISAHNYLIKTYKVIDPTKNTEYTSNITVAELIETLVSGISGPVWPSRVLDWQDLFLDQTNWLNSNVELLNYHDFENECRKLMNIFDIDLNYNIPITNNSENKIIPTDIEKNLIQSFYKKDYDFFSNSGIYYNV